MDLEVVALGLQRGGTTTQPAPFDQVVNGALGSPFDRNDYTFTAAANQQITFNLLAAANPRRSSSPSPHPMGRLYSSTRRPAPALLNLSQTGTYTLSADALSGLPGAYSFRIDQTALAVLTLGSPTRERSRAATSPSSSPCRWPARKTCWSCSRTRRPPTRMSSTSSSALPDPVGLPVPVHAARLGQRQLARPERGAGHLVHSGLRRLGAAAEHLHDHRHHRRHLFDRLDA